jgi:glycerol uptake facilitator-like aquaporin
MWRSLLAELIGTFFFVTVILTITTTYPANIFVPIVIGLALALAIYFTLTSSKGSMNPAVTLALYARGDIDGKTAIMYMAAEFTGAAIAFLWWYYMVKTC